MYDKFKNILNCGGRIYEKWALFLLKIFIKIQQWRYQVLTFLWWVKLFALFWLICLKKCLVLPIHKTTYGLQIFYVVFLLTYLFLLINFLHLTQG